MKKFCVYLFAMSLMSGCGSLTKKVEVEQVKQVKSFALVSFSAFLPSSVINLKLHSIEHSIATDRMYTSLAEKFANTLNAKALPKEKMIENIAYKAAYKQTMEGLQNKALPPEGIRHFQNANVMDKDCLRLLDYTGRNQLMKALNVDALVGTEVTVTLEGFTVAGIGSRKPETRVFFRMYKRDVEDPIWFETLKGLRSEESVGATGFIDEAKLETLAEKSFNTALENIKIE